MASPPPALPPQWTSSPGPQPPPPAAPPVYGLLSRTIVHAPVVKQILPARIRRPDLYDVVFVGETFIELSVLTSNGKLQKVGSKSDFRADIRDARVFGSLRESNFSGMPVPKSMKPERTDAARARLPADILVLTLDSGLLAFVYAKDSRERGEVEFVVSTKRIDSRGVHPTHLGKSIAVDPYSRAIAVTAYQDSFRIFALHSLEEIHRQIAQGRPLNPIKEERTFSVRGGFIAHAEFLYPSRSDRDQVLLVLFFIDSEKKSRLQLYEWTSTQSLQSATKQGQNGLRLPEVVSLPIHIIPLVMRSAFLIITEYYTHVVKASDITDGNASFPRVVLSSGDQRPGKTGPTRGTDVATRFETLPLVTAWSRPHRHPQYAGIHDDVYLAMENGDIYYLEITETPTLHLAHSSSKASRISCAIGSAFAVLDNGLGRDDMIVVGGEMSSGGIYLIEISAYPVDTGAKQEESVANWAPVFDFELVSSSCTGQANGVAERDRVFACTGRGEHGALMELRYGIEAIVRQPSGFVSGVRRLFDLADNSKTSARNSGYFVLCSLAEESFLCYRSLSGKDRGWWDCGQMYSLVMDEATLAAGSVELPIDVDVGAYAESVSWSVQVTQSTITLVQLWRTEPADRSPSRNCFRQECDEGSAITSAALYSSFLIIALRNGPDLSLVLASIKVEKDSDKFLVPVGEPAPLEAEPTFVEIVEVRGRALALVGTQKGTILIFRCDGSMGLVPVKEQTIVVQNHTDFCESAAIIETENAAKLLCGMRSGTVVVLNVTTVESSFGLDLHFEKCVDMKFGPIPAQLRQDVRRRDSAFVSAGSEVYRFDMPHGNFKATQLVFTAKDRTIQPSVQAIVQLNNPADEGDILLCVARDQIFCADVGESGKVCVRRLQLGQTPRRVLFYEALGVFVVACSKTFLQTSGKSDVDRKSYCSLKIIDPKTGESRLGTGEDAKDGLTIGKPDEQINSLIEWNIELGGNKYRYIALGIGPNSYHSSSTRPGRVAVFSLRQNADGTIEVKLRFQESCDEPVYSLARYGPSCLLFCAGRKLYLKTLTLESRKLVSTAEIKLRSPAVHISVTEPWIYLSCVGDSILAVKFEDGKLVESFSDEVARSAYHHVKLQPDLVVASDKQYGIVGLWQPQNKPTLQSLKTIFEVELTSSISRIRLGSCLPPWASSTRSIPGVTSGDQSIIAAGVDGSFFQLTILNEDALRLLRFIQQLYRAELNGKAFVPINEALGEMDPRRAHVDGDLLAALLKLGVDWLRRAVQRAENGPRQYAFNGEGEGFRGAAVRVLGEEADLYEAAMRYVDELVNSVVL